MVTRALMLGLAVLVTGETTRAQSCGPVPGGGDAGADDGGQPALDAGASHVKNVFVIMMENHSATSIYGSGSAPYFNGTLVPMGARATQYTTHVHPSEPNYVWLEAGDNLGITTDADPVPNNELATTDHLTTQLSAAGLGWKAYVEDIDGTSCPLTSSGNYAVKHTPQLFFSDVTDGFSKTSSTCIAHVRPFAELATDLAASTVPAYAFITPNLCDDMHGALGCGTGNLDLVKAGDDWLAKNVPTILASNAFKAGGLLLVVWDEGDEALGSTASDGPLPFVAVGTGVKPNSQSSLTYTHSSTLKTVEEIFGLPLLRGAADPSTNDLRDMFSEFP